MKVYQFEFSSNTNYSFIHLVNGIYHKIHILYDSSTDSYYMNVDKYINNDFVNIINNVRITMGVNVFLQFQYYNLGEFLIIPITDKLYRKDPSSSTIKNGYIILWSHN